MKKDAYLIIGSVTLLIVIFVGAMMLYKKNNPNVNSGSIEQATQRVEMSVLVKEWSPSIGPTISRVVVVEFLDPECESCRAMHPIVKKLLKDYEGRIRYVLRYMPLHKNSVVAARWLEAAKEQGKFWEALNILFEKQPEWASHHAPQPERIPVILQTVGIDVVRGAKVKEQTEIGTRVEEDKKDGTMAGVTGTPSFFVNGRMLMDLGDAPLRRMIEEEMNSKN